MADTYRIFSDQVGMYPPAMSDAEERAYFSVIADASLPRRVREAAARKVAENHVRFAVAVASRYAGPKFPLTDLVGEAAAGMYRAALSFDPSRGNRFISYAVWWARMYVQEYIYSSGDTVRLPDSKLLALGKLARAEREGKDPSGIFTARELRELYDARNARDVRPMDDPVRQDMPDGPTFAETACGERLDEEIDRARIAARLVRDAGAELSRDELAVVLGSYGADGGPEMTARAMAESTGRSRERVRNIKTAALRKLSEKLDPERYGLSGGRGGNTGGNTAGNTAGNVSRAGKRRRDRKRDGEGADIITELLVPAMETKP